MLQAPRNYSWKYAILPTQFFTGRGQTDTLLALVDAGANLEHQDM